MPSESKAQFRLMARACGDAKFAESKGISQATACEWLAEDYRKACRNPDHASLIGVTQGEACSRSKKKECEIIRGKLLKDLD